MRHRTWICSSAEASEWQVLGTALLLAGWIKSKSLGMTHAELLRQLDCRGVGRVCLKAIVFRSDSVLKVKGKGPCELLQVSNVDSR